jgi:YD repeat-containing protein
MTGGETDYYNLAGLLTEKDEYGFGATTPTRKTVTTYAALGNNILDRPSTVTVYDGNSNVAGQTSYSYDEYSLSSSGVSSLSAISGSRGNQTSATKYSSASASVVSHAHFDDAGQTVSTADGNGNVTLYGYDSTDTYLTRKTYPTVTAGTFSETFTVDSSTGLTTKSKNLSSNITGYAYDSMLRKTGVCSADGGYTLTSYPSSTTQTVARLTGSGAGCTAGGGTPSGTFATSTMEYDGYGRLLHNTDPAGDVTDTSYDSMGRIYSQSNPHTGASTSGTVYHIYDALGRETKRTDQDGSFQYWCYNGVSTAGQPNCKSHIGSKTGTWVDYQDENGNQWQRTSDALGRLIEVAEPNGASTAATMETDYSFDALDNLLSVTQYGGLYGTSGSRTRSFNYDRLSRLLCASNPENSTGICSSTASGAYVPGTTGYTYDANGNVTSKTDAQSKRERRS